MSVNGVLLQALPSARKVLELGVRDGGALAAAYRQRHPGVVWTSVADGATIADGDFDLVVVNDSLGAMANPAASLAALNGRLAPNAKLVAAVANGAHAQIVGQLLMGDITYRAGGILDPARPRLFSCSSAYKLLLDAGWLPQLSAQFEPPPANDPVTKALVEAARLLGAPENTARRLLGIGQYIIEAVPWAEHALPRGEASVSVVVAVNRPLQHHINIEASPGIAEIGADVVPVMGARTAAEAFEQGKARARGEWIVFCHQDVYVPAGAGVAITREADRLTAAGRKDTLFGFAGLSRNGEGLSVPAGLMIDRVNRFDHPASDAAISLDEFAVVMHRDSPHRLDPALGWHLWATDLVLQAQRCGLASSVVRAPLFHNSLSDWNLPKDFSDSAAILRAKYPDAGPIDSLCVAIP